MGKSEQSTSHGVSRQEQYGGQHKCALDGDESVLLGGQVEEYELIQGEGEDFLQQSDGKEGRDEG